MKHFLLLLFGTLSAMTVFAQQAAPLYFYGETLTADKDKATSYGIYGKLIDDNLWTFKRFDLDNNLLQSGSYKDEKLSIPHGKFIFYEDLELFNFTHHTNFKLKGKTRFVSQQGYYENGLIKGEWNLYYPNGNVLNSQKYVDGKLNGEFVTYDEFGKPKIKGNYIEGKMDGKWIFGGGKEIMIYDKGKLLERYRDGKRKKTTGKVNVKEGSL
jgi:hypothetical protein